MVPPGHPSWSQRSEGGVSCLPPELARSTPRIAGRSPRATRPTGGPPRPRDVYELVVVGGGPVLIPELAGFAGVSRLPMAE